MKSPQRPLIILAIGLTLFSCKKSDLQDTSSVNAVSKTDSVSTVSNTAAWTALTNWNKVDREKFDVYINNISDAKITAATAESGMVLVYMKNAKDGSVIRLPYEEKTAGATKYWYYQVTEGKILVSCDVTGAKELGANNEFGHVVFSSDDLKSMEQKGITKGQVIKMNFLEAVKNAISK